MGACGVDENDAVVRAASEIFDREGRRVLDGLDVVQLTADGQLRRILVFRARCRRETNMTAEFVSVRGRSNNPTDGFKRL